MRLRNKIEAQLVREVSNLRQRNYELGTDKDGSPQEFLSGIYTCSTDAMGYANLEGKALDVNDSFCRLTGYSREELLTKKSCQDLTPEEYHEYSVKIIQGVIRTGQPGEYEKEYIRKDGTRVPILVTTFLIKTEDGKPMGTAAVIKDITERKRAESSLKMSERRYRAIFDNASEGIFVNDLAGNIVLANQAMAELSGYALNELNGMNISRFLESSSFDVFIESQKRWLEDKDNSEVQRCELQMLNKQGIAKTIETASSLLTDGHDLPLIQTLARDITKHKRIHENMRNLTQAVIRAQEEERSRIARELHDETAQALVSLGMDINSLYREDLRLPRDVMDNLKRLRDKTNVILHGVRHLSRALRPPMLEELGLLAAVEGLTKDLTSPYGINARFEVQGTSRRLPVECELALFRIAQEALNNIVKHAQATKAAVRIHFKPKNVKISISDNGQGFEIPELIGDFARSGKFGMIGMQERARLVGGKVNFEPRSHGGTIITVQVPL